MEGGKSGEKSHNDGDNVVKDKNSKHPPNDSPPQQHFPHDAPLLKSHMLSHLQQTNKKYSSNIVGLKPCSLNDMLHILKELEYTLLIIPHLEGYYFIYHLQTCLSIGFVAPMFNARILIGDFEHMWKI